MRKQFAIRGFIDITGRTSDSELVDALRDEILAAFDGYTVVADDGEFEVEGTLDVVAVDYVSGRD